MFALPGLKSCRESVLSSRRPFTAAPASHFNAKPQEEEQAVAMDMQRASFTVKKGQLNVCYGGFLLKDSGRIGMVE